MVLVDQLIPQAFIRGSPDHVDFQRTKLGDRSVNLRGVVAIAASNSLAGLPMIRCGQRRGEVDELFFFELEQQRTAGHPFELPVRLPPVPVLTQHSGNGGSTAFPMPGDGIADKREVFLSDLTATNLIQRLCQGAVPSWQSTLAKFSR